MSNFDDHRNRQGSAELFAQKFHPVLSQTGGPFRCRCVFTKRCLSDGFDQRQVSCIGIDFHRIAAHDGAARNGDISLTLGDRQIVEEKSIDGEIEVAGLQGYVATFVIIGLGDVGQNLGTGIHRDIRMIESDIEKRIVRI